MNTRRAPDMAWVLLSIAAFIAVGWATLPDYGLTWDECLGDLFFGDRYYAFIVSGFNQRYLDFSQRALDYYLEPEQMDFYRSRFRGVPEEYWPTPLVVTAFFGDLLNRRFGLFDPGEARHAGIVVLGAGALLATWLFARAALGRAAAFLALLMLATHPHYWGHVHDNAKDIGLTAFYTAALVALWRGLGQSRVRWLASGAVLLGLAVACKPNALFIPLTLVLWLAVSPAARRTAFIRPRRWPVAPVWLVPPVAVATYFVSWPYLWSDPLGRLQLLWEHCTRRASGGPMPGVLYPLKEATVTMPLPMLAFLALGLVILGVAIVRRRAAPGQMLLLVWLAVPFARSMVPPAVNYDGIRRFLEFLPAAAVVAGAGAAWFVEALSRHMGPRARIPAVVCVALLATVPACVQNARYHPYETTYVNSLARGIPPEDYWANSYREGCRWLNAHAAPNARVAVPIGDQILEIAAPLWLRGDLQAVRYQSARPPIGSAPVYVMMLNRAAWGTAEHEWLRHEGECVHDIRVREQPILQIYRLDSLPPPQGCAQPPPRARAYGTHTSAVTEQAA